MSLNGIRFHFVLVLIPIFFLLLSCETQSPNLSETGRTVASLLKESPGSQACGLSPSRHRQIRNLVESVIFGGKWHLLESARQKNNYPAIIYDLQELTANILTASGNCRDVVLMDHLSQLYGEAFSHLKYDINGDAIWPGADGAEVSLYSTQFIYAAAKLIKTIAQTDRVSWSKSMNDFMYGPRSHVKAHLVRWVRKASVAPCFGHNKVLTYPELVKAKFKRELGPETYCNSMGEPEMWAAAAAIELLTAPDWVGLSDEDIQALESYIKASTKLFESRLSTRDACPGGTCKGLLFDVGGWKGHPEYPSNIWTVGGETWDFSHMRRIVQWVDSLYLNPTLSGVSYADHYGMVALLSNELYYQVFNRDTKSPAFTNFWNGWNFEYRNYKKNELSSSYYRAGYGFWGQYRSEIASINQALLDILENKQATPYMTPNGSPPDGEIDLVNFLCSLTQAR